MTRGDAPGDLFILFEAPRKLVRLTAANDYIRLVNALLEQILRTQTVQRADGEFVPLAANTSRGQCEFLQQIARRIGARNSLEIGLAQGISAMAIAEASGGSLTAIDPHQAGFGQNIGLLNLERAGFSVRHFEEPSQDVLPRLNGERFDFAYVDTTKIFDMVLVDAFYVTRLLRIGGVVVFDDCSWPGIRKLVRYLARWPHLSVYGTYGGDPPNYARRLGHLAARVTPYARRVFRPELVDTDESLGIAAECVAFEKIAEDSRNWDWSVVP